MVNSLYSRSGYVFYGSSGESDASSMSSYHPSYESAEEDSQSILDADESRQNCSDPISEKKSYASSASFSPSYESEDSYSEEYSNSESRISRLAQQNFEQASVDSEDEILEKLSQIETRKRKFARLKEGADPQKEAVQKTFESSLSYETESEDSSDEIERDLIRKQEEVTNRPKKRLKLDASQKVRDFPWDYKFPFKDNYEEIEFKIS